MVWKSHVPHTLALGRRTSGETFLIELIERNFANDIFQMLIKYHYKLFFALGIKNGFTFNLQFADNKMQE